MIRGYDHYRSDRGAKRPPRARRRRRSSRPSSFVGTLAAVFRVDRLLFRPREARHTVAELSTLWSEGRYDEVLAAAEAMLKRDPLNPGALAFRGFAAFQKGVGEGTAEERTPWLDEAVVSLRRARLVSDQLAAEIEYMLAKAAYHRGQVLLRPDHRATCRARSTGATCGRTATSTSAWRGRQLGDPEKGLAAFLRALAAGAERHPALDNRADLPTR